jgi:hypothetical protein
MASTEAVLRNLEVLQMQMKCQADFAASGLELALDSVAHWRQVADGFKSDCEQKMRALESVARFQNAATIFTELLDACQWFIRAAGQEMNGVGDTVD